MLSKKKTVKVTAQSLEEFLGVPKFAMARSNPRIRSASSPALPGPTSAASCSPSKAS